MILIEKPRDILDRRALLRRLADCRHSETGQQAAGGGRSEILKSALAAGRAEVRRRFMEDGDGPRAQAGGALLIDHIIRSLYEETRLEPEAGGAAGLRAAVLAVGGYGRAELAPCSDIDLLFLHEDNAPDDALRKFVKSMLYPLWDMGLKIGQSAHSVTGATQAAGEDPVIRTAFLDARHICGDRDLSTAFSRDFYAAAAGDDGFADDKLAEQDARHRRMGDARYLLEPNLKDGKGGLRDLQTLRWIGKYLYHAERAEDLARQGVLTAREALLFDRTLAFFMTLRCHLHYLTGRAEDRIGFSLQPELARRMGYAARPGRLPVERLMKHYFLNARAVGELTRTFCAALDGGGLRKSAVTTITAAALPDGFVIRNGRLAFTDTARLRDEPARLTRLFRLSQKIGLGVHPRALRAVTRGPGLAAAAAIRRDGDGGRQLMEILCAPENPEPTLRQMNECGLLGRLLPEFGRIVGQMQYNMYHVYTTDEHSLRAVGLLHQVEAGAAADDHPLASRVVRLIADRKVLYAATLLHDIGKGRGGDHSQIGAAIAQEIGPQLGLDAGQTQEVCWLVLHHLAMSETAFKRDLDDPATINAFVALVQSPERLRLLLCLTVADIRGVGPNVWSAWKAALLRQLYARAEQAMSGQAEPQDRKKRLAQGRAALQAVLSRWPAALLDAHIDRFDPLYFLAHDVDALARHARMVRRADRAKAFPAIGITARSDIGVTEVTVYTPDFHGLMSRIAGGLALCGLSVVGAKIHNSGDGMALDSFSVQDIRGGPCERRRYPQIRDMLRRALTTEMDMQAALHQRAQTEPATPHNPIATPPRVLLDNRLSERSTVLEVNAVDRPGLLFVLTRALTRLGLQISRARIASYGERVVDVFYVQNDNGEKITDPAAQQRIRERIRDELLAATAQE